MPGFFIWTSPLKAAYVGTTPVKEIYVWTTKVRPAVQTYSYDFRWKSVAQMQSDWWTWTFNWSTGSSGISNWFYIYKDILNLSSAKKITVKTGFNVTQKSSWSSGSGGTNLRQNDSDWVYGGSSSTLSTSGWCWILFNYGSWRTNWNSYNIPTWSWYINEWEIDLTTKAASVKLYQGTTLLTSITYNLSDSQITEIRAKTKLFVATEWPWFQITTVESTVE